MELSVQIVTLKICRAEFRYKLKINSLDLDELYHGAYFVAF